MNMRTAARIKKEAKPYTGNVNVFILKDGSVEVEPVSGSWGAGVPANPEQYRDYWLDIPAGWLEEVDDIMERLD